MFISNILLNILNIFTLSSYSKFNIENFDKYLLKFNKNYSELVYWNRLDIYSKNLEYIKNHNSKNYTYKLGETQFTDISREEFSNKLGFSNINKNCDFINTGKLFHPKEIDWRNRNAVTTVKNQENCGSCWSFSAIGALEGLRSIKHNQLESLSEQQLIDCSTANNGCHGGTMQMAFEYIINNGGICSNESYPYLAEENICKNNCKILKYTNISSCKNIIPKNEKILLSYLSKQPISVAIQADTINFQHYKEGIFNDINCYTGELDHGVLLVGYDEEKLIVKNSWGNEWGENGYINLARIGNGNGICGVLLNPSFPLY